MMGACSGGVVLEPTEGPVLETRSAAQAATPSTSATGVDLGTPGEIALSASKTYFDSAQIVVLAASSESNAHPRAASIAIALGVPFLLTADAGENTDGHAPGESEGNISQPGGLNTELLRLGTRGVITVGEVSLHQLDTTSLVVHPVPENLSELATTLNLTFSEIPAPAAADEMRALATLEFGQLYSADNLGQGPEKYGRLPATLPAQRNPDVITFSATSTKHYAGVATARAAGGQVFVGNDPGSSVDVVEYVSAHQRDPIVGFGEDLHDPQRLQRLANTLHTGVLLPTGAQRVYRLNDGEVRVLTVEASRLLALEGIDDAKGTLNYAREQAARMAQEIGTPVISGVEVVVSHDNREDLAYWSEQSRQAGQYLVLTVRPRGTPLEAVQEIGEFLTQPNVAVRIDLSGLNSVSASQFNEVNSYVRALVRAERLPQKALIFDLGSSTQITGDIAIVPTTREVALTISVDSDAPAHWDGLHSAVTANVSWGLSLQPIEQEEHDGQHVQYPAIQQALGASELSLVAYR